MLASYGYIYDCFTSVAFWKLRPDTNLVTAVEALSRARKDASTAPPKVMAARSDAGDLALIYLASGAAITLKPDQLRDGLRPIWFNPRDGGTKNARAFKPGTYRTPDANDWVLIFRLPCDCTHREFDEEFEKEKGMR
jgi:hypothetical protein